MNQDHQTSCEGTTKRTKLMERGDGMNKLLRVLITLIIGIAIIVLINLYFWGSLW